MTVRFLAKAAASVRRCRAFCFVLRASWRADHDVAGAVADLAGAFANDPARTVALLRGR